MKITFPNGEHATALLSVGVTTVGSDPQSTIVLGAAGMPALVATINMTSAGVQLVPHADAVTVNNIEIKELIGLRDGDRLGFGSVVGRLKATPVAAAIGEPQADAADVGATRVIASLPKFVLRGVNGLAFGRRFVVSGTTIIGRSEECDIQLESPEISRLHAQLRPTLDGVIVEDLKSSNGVYVNEDRVSQAILRVDDELRIDTARFIVQTIGSEGLLAHPSVRSPQSTSPARAWRLGQVAIAVVIALILLLTVVARLMG